MAPCPERALRIKFLQPAMFALGLSLAAHAGTLPPDSTSARTDKNTVVAGSTMSKGTKDFPRPDSLLASRLREGGYIIVFRHSLTDWGQKDADIENFNDRAAQRNLSKEGEGQAGAMGKSIAALRIPIGRVLTSPMWRCRDTAQLAFGLHETTIDLFKRSKEARVARITMLSTPPETRKNTVLVTHQDVLIPIITGLHRDRLQEGDALIVKPLGEGHFEIVAQISPEDWARLAVAENQ